MQANTENITVSIGLAVYPEHGVTADEFMQAADRSLYNAKAQGRNRTVVAPNINHT